MGYVQSSDRNAYPDFVEQDGNEYEYLGIPYANILNFSKIETGSYTGTGVYGSSNANSLTFSFLPKMVFIHQKGTNNYAHFDCYSLDNQFSRNGYVYVTLVSYITTYTTSDFELAKTVSNVLTWYSDIDLNRQLNISGAVYNYLAIG